MCRLVAETDGGSKQTHRSADGENPTTTGQAGKAERAPAGAAKQSECYVQPGSSERVTDEISVCARKPDYFTSRRLDRRESSPIDGETTR